MKNFVQNWLLPPGISSSLSLLFRPIRAGNNDKPEEAMVSPNTAFQGRHTGERCFILCNGPSVSHQDLRLLEGEAVCSVSNGYHHAEYRTFQPRYHFVPQVTYGVMDRTRVIAWFSEMHEWIGDAELFLSVTEQPLVEDAKLFPGRTPHYLWLHEHMDYQNRENLIDISGPVPGVQSVPIMALMATMYMGFSEIILLGVEHNDFLTGEYRYFFETSVLTSRDMFLDESGKLTVSRYEQFQSLAALWRQYRVLKEIACANGVTILNATHGGELDEFERVQFESLFTGSKRQGIHAGSKG